jgi:hypothetical protein
LQRRIRGTPLQGRQNHGRGRNSTATGALASGEGAAGSPRDVSKFGEQSVCVTKTDQLTLNKESCQTYEQSECGIKTDQLTLNKESCQTYEQS